MKRFLKYIFIALISCIGLISCVKELELETPVANNDEVTLVPRVKSFTNQYVTKASEYSGNEKTISKIALLLFNKDGDLVYITQPANVSSVKLNKTMLNSPAQQGKLTSATVIMLANVDLGNVKKSDSHSLQTEYNAFSDNDPDTAVSLTLSDMANYSIHIPAGKSIITSAMLNDTENPFAGFPMMGGTTIDFTSDAETESVDLKILYAKINVEISVSEGGENQKYGKSDNEMTFSLTDCKVYNTSRQTGLSYPTEKNQPEFEFWGVEKDPVVNATSTSATTANHENQSGLQVHAGGKADLGNALQNIPPKKIAFTFYMSENRFNPNSDLSGVYPDDLWLNTTDYDDYKQHYKPQVAAKSGGSPVADGKSLATYVVLNGTYVDYRGTSWTVDYTVHLGKDNYQNFQVDRNSEYTNYLAIKGIRNNSDYGDGDVWIDHRVNVELGQGQGLDDCITITRETLIDSHFEVRPLRINLTGKNYKGACVFLPRYNGKQITEKKGDGVNQNWIAIENNNGTRYQDITQYCANGKRKYFTTDLIEDLHLNNPDIQENSSELVIPLENNDCIWIYIDEYTTSGATSVREAQIELRFYKSTTSYDSEIYTIRQKPLHPVGNYYIESYEEYLHSYDSEDNYNLGTSTKDYPQPGIVWGLAGEALSNDVLVSVTPLIGLGWIDIRNSIDQRYDYLPSSDESRYRYVKNGNSWSSVNSENPERGLEFTGRASARTNMTIIDMGNPPSSAYQYCLSKNKFKKGADGSHSMDIHWYLPDVYELQLILAAGQSSADIVDNAYYWSSQPAFDIKGLDELPLISELVDKYPSLLEELGVDPDALGVFDEDITYARAVAGKAGVSNEKRTETHRVRCLYSETGIPNVNMANRAPDGIGPKVIHMRARRLDTGGAGYFAQYVPKEPTEVDPMPTQEFEGEDDDYAYPTRGDYSDGSFSYDPMLNWVTRLSASRGDAIPDVDKFTLGKYPGLSAKIIEDRQLVVGTTDYTILEGSDWKSDTEIIVSSTEKVVDYSNLGDDKLTLNKLDGTNGIFSIAFSIGNNTKNYPKYYYYEETGKVTETWTRHWKIPEYYKDTFITTEEDVISNKTFNGSASDVNTVGDVYVRKKDAKTAAENKAKEMAIKDAISKIVYPGPGYNYEVTSQSATVTESDAYYAVLGYVGTASATATVTIKFTRPVGTPIEAWRYTDNTGRWFNEEDEEWPNEETNDNEWPNYYTKETVTTPKYNNDELTFYSGNKFTISVAQGYVIGGVKVHFSGSNTISRTDTYLRFVPEGYNSSTDHPERMSFVDGDSGYAEWGTQEGCSQVTLQLSEATLTEPSWIQQIFGQTATINYKTNNLSYTSESVIIEKIEITYMSDSN